MTVTIRRAGAPDRKMLAHMLASAFVSDPGSCPHREVKVRAHGLLVQWKVSKIRADQLF
jgi:hypothetical protein